MLLARVLNLLVLLVFVMQVGVATSQARGDEELKAILKLLEKRLVQPEGAAPATATDRVTEIGSSRRPVVVEEEEKEVVRIYDLSDLFTIAPPYLATHSSDLRSTAGQYFTNDVAMFPTPGARPSGAGGGIGGGLTGIGGGVFNMPSENRGRVAPQGVLPQVGGFGLAHAEGNFGGSRISFDDLIEAITYTIEPEQWEEVGGPGSIQPLGNALIIRAKPGIHEQVDKLLALLRQKWGTLRTISVEAWWLWMNETEANRLLIQGRPEAGENAKVFGAVDNLTFLAHVQEFAEDEKRRPGYRAKITCYNGQTVYTISGGQQLYVTDVVPVVDGKSIAYRPVVSLVQEGAALQVRPHSTRKGKYAALDIHTRVNILPDPKKPSQPAQAKPAEDDENGKDNAKAEEAIAAVNDAALAASQAIDRPRLQNARMSTSLRVPIGQTMLVGAMSFDGQPAAGSESLYFFVKLSLQELRDDVEEKAAGEKIE